MHRHTKERGAALILLIGITAALAILAAAAVMVLANQQGATARDRSDKTSMDYAEAGLDSAVTAVKGKPFSSGSPPTLIQIVPIATPEEMQANYNAAYPSGPTLTAIVYDNQQPVNLTDNYYCGDRGGPITATTPDGKVWVEVQVTYQGRTTRLRQMVAETRTVVGLPQAALFCDQDITSSGTSDIYAVKPDGTAVTSGNPPYQTDVTARGNFTSTGGANLAAPGSSNQSLGVHVNGTYSLPAIGNPPGVKGVVIGGVPLLSDYFSQAAQSALVTAAQAGKGALGKGFANPSGTAVAPTLFTPASIMSVPGVTKVGNVYTFANDLVVSGNLTLQSGTGYFPSGTTFNFKSLYVNGSLSLTNQVTVNTTALYVSAGFTIGGATSAVIDQFGPIYVAGIVTWSGTASVKTTNYTDSDPQQTPGALWVGKAITVSGVYNHVLGPTWVVGYPKTATVAVNFSAISTSTVLCPLMATTEKIQTSGPCNFGSLAQPMVLYMVCDNDSAYTNTCVWGSSGTFTGLMVLMEAQIQLTNGAGTLASPTILGALFCAFDVTMSNASSICYNQTVIDNVTQASITTKSRTTVPGTWQELSPN